MSSPDTLGLMVGLVGHAADVQDCDGALAVLRSIRRTFPWLRHLFADGAYAGPKAATAPSPRSRPSPLHRAIVSVFRSP